MVRVEVNYAEGEPRRSVWKSVDFRVVAIRTGSVELVLVGLAGAGLGAAKALPALVTFLEMMRDWNSKRAMSGAEIQKLEAETKKLVAEARSAEVEAQAAEARLRDNESSGDADVLRLVDAVNRKLLEMGVRDVSIVVTRVRPPLLRNRILSMLRANTVPSPTQLHAVRKIMGTVDRVEELDLP
jgi:hypothetical protein